MVSHEVEAFLLIRTYPVMMGSDSTSAQTLGTRILGQDFHDHVTALVVGRVGIEKVHSTCPCKKSQEVQKDKFKFKTDKKKRPNRAKKQ